jgi:hypothetical protein
MLLELSLEVMDREVNVLLHQACYVNSMGRGIKDWYLTMISIISIFLGDEAVIILVQAHLFVSYACRRINLNDSLTFRSTALSLALDSMALYLYIRNPEMT